MARALFVPAGFSAGLADGQPQVIRLVSHPDADNKKTEAVRLVLDGVVSGMSLEAQILASLQQIADMQADSPAAVREAFTYEAMAEQARSQFASSQERPLVEMVQRVPGQEEEQEQDPDMSQASVPGFAVLFVFLTAQATARSIYDEKKAGTFRRLLAAPVAKLSLVLGKMLPNFLIALVQFAVILLFGVFGLRLLGMSPVPLGHDPLALVVFVVMTALCSSAFGIVIAVSRGVFGSCALAVASLFVWGFGDAAAALIGIGSSIFHPEASRLARLSSGGRYGFAQSTFQVGGNFGTALGPLLAAVIVVRYGQSSVAWLAAIEDEWEQCESRRQRRHQDRRESFFGAAQHQRCLLYTSPSPRDRTRSRMPSSA